MEHLSLCQLQSLIKKGIDEAHPLPYLVMAEISELKVNYSGHCYLELVEKGEDNHVPKAKLSAVIWRSTYQMVSHYFMSATGQQLSAGLKVLVKGVVAYSGIYGLSLQITDIDPAYTLGDMEQQRQKTIEQLKKDGVYDMNREIPLPEVIQRIAVVSSRNAAGYQDFMNELSKGGFYYEVTLFDAFMQGDAAEDSIVDALCGIAQDVDNFDVVVMIRGGGSQSDLGCFNSYRLASYVAQFPLPVITGIGHDKDQSVADLVAALSLKTPTAVAVYLNETLDRFDAMLYELQQMITDEAAGLVERSGQRLQKAVSSIGMVSHLFTIQSNRLSSASQSLKEKCKAFLASRSKELSLLGQLVESSSPERIVDLGFAVVRSGGRIVRDGAGLSEKEKIEILMRDTVVGATVDEIKKRNDG